MTLPLELGAIQDGFIRRAFENLAQRFPIAALDLATATKPVTLKGSYETLYHANCTAVALATGATYTPFLNGGFATVGTASSSPAILCSLDPADHDITGLTTMLRMRVGFDTNATAPTGTWTLGLYPVSSVAGGAGVFDIATVGSVLGSVSSAAGPAASTTFNLVGSDFAFPAAGQYVFGLTTSVNQAASSAVSISFQLQKHYI